ncbi:pumilio homolog 23 isoform X2 [Ananas comosus]|uniref:Pumilio homolog 23 isoform X2 n=1 Tax=Ananas comosus TaxID=4615 RepID=A0A6P5G8N6_ANACO|nr:pumilio homolog 23 isoform X2 [Ananas comosus]
MVCVGSKTIKRKKLKPSSSDTGDEEDTSKRRGRKKGKDKKPREGHSRLPEGSSSKKRQNRKIKEKNLGKRPHDRVKNDPSEGSSKSGNGKNLKSSKNFEPSKPVQSILRKRVDPETAKYFSEIANLFESNAIDLEDRATICGNALEETRGKELELATDIVISRTLQNLLEGCELDQLCGFLHNCAEVFATIAMDKFGSHVIETALRSLAKHQDERSYCYIEETLHLMCQVVAADAANVMQSRYGSHVLRSLLCLCKGVPLDSLEEYHTTKPSAVLSERLNPAKSVDKNPGRLENGFIDTFKFLVRETLNHAKDEISALRADKYSSFVLQTALKLSVGNDQELIHAISILLGGHEENVSQEKLIDSERKQEIMVLLGDPASSHLLEVIIEVAPETLYAELLTEVFKGSLFEISSHPYGNFVVQALIASARTSDHINLISEELCPKLKELLELGKPGVVASILAACQRLQVNGRECCEALAAAVNSDPESPSHVVSHILFLESYFRDKADWEWPPSGKMNVLGCLMLQTIFKYPNQYIRPYIASITSMDDAHIFQTAKDAGGSRVLEAFLSSAASTKLKLKVIAKLRGHYGELALNPSSSFTIEKCFSASNVSLKETMAEELVAVQAELSKTKHGPYILKKLDIDGFARRPEQWKKSQSSKEAAYREFQATFGSKNEHGSNEQPPESSQKSSNRRKRKEKASDDTDHGDNLANEYQETEICKRNCW